MQSGAFDSCISLYLLRIIRPFPLLLYSSSYVFVHLSLQEKQLYCLRFVLTRFFFFLPQELFGSELARK